MTDAVGKFLRSRGCPDHVVQGGIEGLVATWEQTVHNVARGYALGLEDYLNDMDGRQLLEEALAVAPPKLRQPVAERVRKADALMKKVVAAAHVCLWGKETARERGWTADRNWWYYVKPLKAGPELLTDLQGLT
jgi:hypothetical protein